MARTVRTIGRRPSLAPAAVAAALVLGMAGAAIADTLTLRMGHVNRPGSVWYETAERFAELATERTDGAVTFNIAHSGQLGTWQEMIEALQIGVLDVVLESVGTLDRYDTLPGIEAYPYLIRDLDHFDKVYYGPVGAELFEAIREATGYRIVGAGYRGARFLTADRPITSLEELRGFRMRVPPLRMYRLTWEHLGASGNPMAWLETYTALQQGVVNGQENPVDVAESYRLYEVQTHLMRTAHVIGAMTFIFWDERFQSWPEDVQEALIEAGEEAMRWGTVRMVEREQELLDIVQSNGMEVLEVETGPWRAALEPMADDFPELAEWVERVQAVD